MSLSGRRGRGSGARLALLTLLLGSTAACTGGDEEPEEPTPEQGAEAPAAVETKASVGQVAGRLPRPARRAALGEVVDAVDTWIDAAHVGGEWPREIGAEAYESFTPAATRAARRDPALTSAAEISEQVEQVEVKRRVVRVDLVGAGGRAVGATARVALTYRTTGEEEQTVRVRGRLLLTPTKQGWKIFGHDLTEETR